jgi:hypothetical protein
MKKNLIKIKDFFTLQSISCESYNKGHRQVGTHRHQQLISQALTHPDHVTQNRTELLANRKSQSASQHNDQTNTHTIMQV